MADSSVSITAGSGTLVDTRTVGAEHRQVIVIGDETTNAACAPVSATDGLLVNLGSNNDVTVTSGTVTANAGSGTFTVSGTVTANAGTGTLTTDQTNAAEADYDTGAGTVNQVMFGVALPASGGPVAGGTSTNPLRVDPTGSTTQPVSLASVPSHAVTNAGTFAVQVDGAALTALQLIDDAVFAEDAAHTTGDKGIQALAVRNDSDASLAGTTGDYTPLQVDATGYLKVNIKAGGGTGGTAMTDDAAFTAASTSFTPVGGIVTADSVDSGDGGAFAMLANRQQKVTLYDSAGVELSVGGGTQYDEDTAHVSGDKVTLAGVVRRDANTTLADTDGDRTALQVNSSGALKVAITSASSVSVSNEPNVNVISNIPGTGATNLGKAEDAVHASGDVGVMALAVRQNTQADFGADGDYVPLSIADDGGVRVSSTNTAAASPISVRISDGSAFPTPSADYTHDAALTVASTAGPALIARAASSAPTAVANDDAVLLLATLLGKSVTYPYAIPASTWNYAAAAGGLVNTTGVTAKAAAGVGVRNYITRAQIVNSHQTTSTEIVIRDGAAGTVLFRDWAQAAGGGSSVVFDPPLRGTANTLIEIAEVTATATAGVLVNLQGFEASE